MARTDSSVFKSYDIRGTYPRQLDERFAYRLGRALPRVLPCGRVVLGHDARLSSPALYGALAAGFADGGSHVSGLGLCATELVYYATGAARDWDLGVMITASHNPPEYNGFKVVKAGGEPVAGSGGLLAARELMEALPDAARAQAPHDAVSALADYTDFALDLVGKPDVAGLSVAVDAGNGVAGLLWDELALRLGVRLVRLNFEPDGRFPAHHPDPSRRENLESLTRAVRGRTDLGFAYDGDADRVVVVLPDGHVVDGSEMIVCIADHALARDPQTVFGVGQTTSRKALDHFAGRGVHPVVVPVGHAKIKAVMRSQPEMALAGEDAGHYYYRDFFCCDSSLITTLQLLHLAGGGRLAGIVASLPGPWHRPEREPSFHFAEQERALATCRRVAARAMEAEPGWQEMSCEVGGRVLRGCRAEDAMRSDGVRVDYPDWWFCVRPSGTEPIARLALEARSAPEMAEKARFLSALFGEMAS